MADKFTWDNLSRTSQEWLLESIGAYSKESTPPEEVLEIQRELCSRLGVLETNSLSSRPSCSFPQSRAFANNPPESLDHPPNHSNFPSPPKTRRRTQRTSQVHSFSPRSHVSLSQLSQATETFEDDMSDKDTSEEDNTPFVSNNFSAYLDSLPRGRTPNPLATRRIRRRGSSCPRGGVIIPTRKQLATEKAAHPSTYDTYASAFMSPTSKHLVDLVNRVGSHMLSYADSEERNNAMYSLLGADVEAVLVSDTTTTMGLVRLCSRTNQVKLAASFGSIIAKLALTLKIDAQRFSTKRSIHQIWQDIRSDVTGSGIVCARSTFYTWLSEGTAWAILGQAGGLYLIIAVVLAGEARTVTELYDALKISSFMNMAYQMRIPDRDTRLGKLVVDLIAPAIAELRREFMIVDVNGFLIGDLSHSISVSGAIDLSTWADSDKFFEAFVTETTRLPGRTLSVWEDTSNDGPSHPVKIQITRALHCVLAEQPAVDDGPVQAWTWSDLSPTLAQSACTVVTNFDVAHVKNKFLLRAKDKDVIHAQTEEWREAATSAYCPTGFVDFEARFQKLVEEGWRPNTSEFIVLDRRTILKSQQAPLRILGCNQEPFFISLPSLSANVVAGVKTALDAGFPGVLVDIDSMAAGRDHQFQCLHNVWYNRSSRRGHDAPADANMYNIGKKGKKREDPSQSGPRPSSEAQDERLSNIDSALRALAAEIETNLRLVMPEESFQVMSAYYESLPGHAHPPLYPFGGYVINFNVVTRAHRDHGDLGFCLIINIMDGEGGDLVLHEPGLVIRVITHYNLHFRGQRISVVFHSDHDGIAWSCIGLSLPGAAVLRMQYPFLLGPVALTTSKAQTNPVSSPNASQPSSHTSSNKVDPKGFTGATRTSLSGTSQPDKANTPSSAPQATGGIFLNKMKERESKVRQQAATEGTPIPGGHSTAPSQTRCSAGPPQFDPSVRKTAAAFKNNTGRDPDDKRNSRARKKASTAPSEPKPNPEDEELVIHVILIPYTKDANSGVLFVPNST
ncbi:hypothetical protein CYLTODRAFT_447859, partial [Cylindrobasidium torrendii FP15055 ss-10]